MSVFAASTDNSDFGVINESMVDRLNISFVEDAQLSEIEAFIESGNIVLNSFMVTTEVNDITYTSGYVINIPDEFGELWEDFLYLQTSLLAEGINANEDLTIISDMQTMMDALEEGNIQLSIVCEIPSVSTHHNDFTYADIIDSVQQLDNAIQPSSNSSMSLQSTMASNWVPTSGYASCWASQNVSDATYLEAIYRWNNDNALSTLTNDSDSTLEADLVLYNYDNQALATSWHSNYTYSTNQPSPYQDTQAFDSDDEVVFSIGCSDASSLESGVDYYWIAYGNETSSTECMAKLNFQRGHRVLNWIYGEKWNVFGDETVVKIPFSSWTAQADLYQHAYFN
jgi:hypothetical protein